MDSGTLGIFNAYHMYAGTLETEGHVAIVFHLVFLAAVKFEKKAKE